jgi:cell shape-determining protein MreC
MTKVMGKKWGFDEEIKNSEIILNYIDKLQKELKDSINARFELQRRIDKLQKENEELKEEIEHKNKIRTKILELLGE